MAKWDRYRDKRAVYQAGLRASQYGVSGSFTLEEWLALCAKHNQKCVHCELPEPLTPDHIIPLIKGGTNNIDNIQPLCKSCNSRKGYNMQGDSCPKCGGSGPFPPRYDLCHSCLSKHKANWYQKNKEGIKKRKEMRLANPSKTYEQVYREWAITRESEDND